MFNALSTSSARTSSLANPPLRWAGLLLAGLSACNLGTGGTETGQSGTVGSEADKPDGSGTFFVDENQGGGASRIHIQEMFWGRLVDVHDIDANGDAVVQPRFRNLAINENIQTDGVNYVLDTNPVTQQTRLVIQRQKGAADTGSGSFDSLLRAATSGMPPIAPLSDTATNGTPSFIARNGCLVMRFDDLMDDSAEAVANLLETVRVLTDYPPTIPFSARIIFDPNYGGVASGAFHSTRLLVDTTVSEAEAAGSSVPLTINSLGLPVSLSTSTTRAPNVSLRIPTRVDFGSGQFSILTGLSGGPLATTQNGPIDFDVPTVDVVRAMRSGNAEDTNNGFLLDLNQPQILGGWPITVDSSAVDPTGQAGFDFVVDLTFLTLCAAAPKLGDILSVSNEFVEVTEPAGQPDVVTGEVASVRVRVLTDDPVSTVDLLGSGLFLTAFDEDDQTQIPECFVSFAPQPLTFPATGVPNSAQVLVRFSEPIDPGSVKPFDTFMLIRGSLNDVPSPTARDIVVGSVQPSSDLREFTFTSLLPFAHDGNPNDGDTATYHLDLIEGANGETARITDLAGNPISDDLPPIDFTIDESDTAESNAGFVLRFNSPDEVDTVGANDVRGQIFYDLSRGVITPRNVSYVNYPADRNNPVPGIMIPFPLGVQTPLSPLGSKLMTLWRYADLGFSVRDETKYNLDVIGLNWSPIGAQVVADLYELFEIRLSHSVRLPDEYLDANLLPFYPNSGLLDKPNVYESNRLSDPFEDPNGVIVHPRGDGYTINPADLFVTGQGTFMMPFPYNVGATVLTTYTWRDTRILARGGPDGGGVPLHIEAFPPLNLEPGLQGSVAVSDNVPSFGLPLLMEFRCYPSDSGIGLNSLDISLAINSSARPNFRCYSTGGINTASMPVIKNPDLELTPSGGFNPLSTPPGQPTAFSAENTFYIGQMDTVVRISRAHTVFVNTEFSDPDYFDPILEPSANDQPQGTSVVVEVRGANQFAPGQPTTQSFDATQINAYGDPIANGTITGAPTGITFFGDETWKSDISTIDGAQYLQMRISFFNNIATGLNAELSAIGIAYKSL